MTKLSPAVGIGTSGRQSLLVDDETLRNAADSAPQLAQALGFDASAPEVAPATPAPSPAADDKLDHVPEPELARTPGFRI